MDAGGSNPGLEITDSQPNLLRLEEGPPIFDCGYWPRTNELLDVLFTFWWIFSFKWNIIENEKCVAEKRMNIWTPVPVSITLPTELQWPEYMQSKKISYVATDLWPVLVDILGYHTCWKLDEGWTFSIRIDGTGCRCKKINFWFWPDPMENFQKIIPTQWSKET